MDRDFKGIWIPKEIWLSRDLTIQEKIFLVEIDSLDNEDGCFATNQYFSEFFEISKTRVSIVINNLIKKGYIKSKIIYKEGTKQILNRVLNINRPPYPTYVIDPIKQKLNTPIKQKLKDNNININNTSNNIINKGIYSRADLTGIIDYLNLKTNKHFKYTDSNLNKIKARLNEGFSLEDFKVVIDKKTYEWLKDSKFNQFLRPETLFGSKFESYLNQEVKKKTLSDISFEELEEMANEQGEVHRTIEEDFNSLF